MTNCGCNNEAIVLSSRGAEFDWEIKQGADFSFEGELRYEGTSHVVLDVDGNEVQVGPPIDLTGCLVRCQLRKRGLDAGTPVATATCTIPAPLLGQYRVAFTKVQTAAIPCGELISDRASLYVSDIFLDWPSGETWELSSINTFVLRRVTK